MARNPVLSIPLASVLRSEIALTLQQVLQIHTVGGLLQAWRNPRNHRSIEQVFDTPQQARQCVATCATWLGVKSSVTLGQVPAWWPMEQPAIHMS